jgi:hypothetical protein
MSDQPNQIQPPEPLKKKSSMLAVFLALVPSIILLALLTFFNRSSPPAAFIFVLCGICAVCCFSSSIMLFRQNTAMAILFGILFLLLNGLISLFFGCVALFSGI